MSPTRREFVTQVGAGAALLAATPVLGAALEPPEDAVEGRSVGSVFSLPAPRLVLIGVGSAGTIILDELVARDQQGLELIAIDTDEQSLRIRAAPTKVLLDARSLPRGPGPVRGRLAAQGCHGRLESLLAGADVAVVISGMGGGTGTGASPVVAEVARQAGALTLGLVTLPFGFEGRRRRRQAAVGVRRLDLRTHGTIVLPSDTVLRRHEARTMTLRDALARLDASMCRAAESTTVPLIVPGLINVGLADYRVLFEAAPAALVASEHGGAGTRPAGVTEYLLQRPALAAGASEAVRAALVTIAVGSEDEPLQPEEVGEVSALLQDRFSNATVFVTDVSDKAAGRGCSVTLAATGHPDALGPSPIELDRHFRPRPLPGPDPIAGGAIRRLPHRRSNSR